MSKNYLNCNTIFYQRACDLFGNMTQQRLADMIGIAQGKISDILGFRTLPCNYEKKQPSAEMVVKIAKAFNVSTDYLLGLTDIKSTDIATKELCNTLGLSQDAIEILCRDPNSKLANIWRYIFETEPLYDDGVSEEERAELIRGETLIRIDSEAESIARSINWLIDEHINTFERVSKHMEEYEEDSVLRLIELFNEYAEKDFTEIVNKIHEAIQVRDLESFGQLLLLNGAKDNALSGVILEISTRFTNIKNKMLCNE